jgi:hypothetical protein
MWPTCSNCKSTGVAQEGDGWPVECLACKRRREEAVKKAQADLKKARTA